MNIAFITPSLELGGYEKVVVNYANALSDMGHTVTILCGFQRGALIEQLSPKVNLIDFKARARKYIVPLINYLKNNKVDILYSAFRIYNSIAVLAKKLSRSKVIIYASQHGFEQSNIILKRLQGLIIKKADVLITVAEGIVSYESKELGIPIERFIVFNNPVIYSNQEIPTEVHKWFSENGNIPIICISGRIALDKGKTISVKILSELLRLRKAKMIVLGNGPEKENTINYAKELGIINDIDFLGYVENPMGYVKQCDVFLHTALVEGFGNVIIDALYVDVPVVTTSCSGPIQIIQNNKYGINIGEALDPNTIDRGVKAIIDILDKKIQFGNLKERAMDFEVKSSAQQFLDPYYRRMNNG